MLKRILHANDGSEGAFKALAMALDLAKKYNAELHMICVEEISNFPEMIADVKQEKGSADRRFRSVLKRAEEAAAQRHIKLHAHIVTGHPIHTIVELAKDGGFDLLVIGATGHSALYQTMIGSRADRLVHLAPCPVLIAK